MGFKTVYACLTDVFPQVDVRILKAVAIEHSKDADAAVEIVLSEVLPFLSREPAVVPSPSGSDGSTVDPSDGEAEHEEQATGLRHRCSSSEKSVASSSETTLIAKEESGKTDLTDGVHHIDSTRQEDGVNEPARDLDINQYNGNTESEELILLGGVQLQNDTLQTGSSHTPNAADLMQGSTTDQSQVSASDNDMPTLDQHQDINTEVGHEQTPLFRSASLIQETGGSSVSLTDYHSELNDEFDMAKSSQPSYVDCLPVVTNNSVAVPSPNTEEDGLHTGFCSIPNDNKDMISKQYTTDFLDEIVEAAKNNKKNLFMAMESVMTMMKEVELQERAAEQAKEEAARGVLDILAKVEELKQMLAHAKEANDMHAGEIYGEKAILATEARELQARLISLSDERDNALAIIDEMRQTLESRLTAAEELRKAAEQEKMEKEMTAQSALAEQEIIMEKVVQESKILQKQAEKNAKLREFLMDRGQVVDTLQGEVSVICQDVRLLKQNFDQRVPLSKSISSSQTSCILASSGSSVKSMASDPVPELIETSEPPSQTSPTCSVDGQSSATIPELERDTAGKQILDDGWDLLEE